MWTNWLDYSKCLGRPPFWKSFGGNCVPNGSISTHSNQVASMLQLEMGKGGGPLLALGDPFGLQLQTLDVLDFFEEAQLQE